MEEKIVIVLNEMSEYLSITQMKKLQEVIIKTFADNEASKVEISNEEFLKMFLDAKRIEGCSERTIIYYQATVKHLLSQITTEVRKITTEEIREYLSKYQKWNNCSNVTIDNVRRNISSFFSWLEEEDYILKSPMKRIHKIKTKRARSDLHKKIAGIASVANIPEIQAQTDLINKVLNTDYVDTAGINEFEEIREKLRNLMKYLPNSSIRYDTNFTDEVLSTEWNESELENDDLKNYKAKAEYYIRQHQDNIAIAKLKRNKPLTSTDIAMLEEVLWSEVGTKQDYEQEFGEKPLGEFVREIVGLDMNAAKEAFSEYLTNASLDSRQIYFVNQIVEYIVHNGMMKDLSVLQESPFTDRGSVVEIFTDLSVWMGIRKVIDMINANAVA